MRPLLFLVLTVALGYLISQLLIPQASRPTKTGRQATTAVAEEMVRDPVCQLYLPRAEAIRLRSGDGNIFSAVPACLDKFLVRRP